MFCFLIFHLTLKCLLFLQCGLYVNFRENPEWQGSYNETIIGQQVSTLDTNVTKVFSHQLRRDLLVKALADGQKLYTLLLHI